MQLKQQINNSMNMDLDNGPLVTIGIPTFNRGDLLRRAIESALNQDYKNLEVIISDNASTDHTESICRSYIKADPRIRYIKQSENIGAFNNFKVVLDRATGCFFTWLGDDDWFDTNYISVTLKAFQNDPNLSLACGFPKYYLNEIKAFDGKIFNLSRKGRWCRIIAYYWKVEDNGMFYGLMRTEQLSQIPFNNVMGSDWLIISRIAGYGKTVMLEETSVHRNLGGSTVSYHQIAKSSGLPSWEAVFPYSAIAVHALLNIILYDKFYRIYSPIQRLSLGGGVFFTLITKGIKKRIASVKRAVNHFFTRQSHV